MTGNGQYKGLISFAALTLMVSLIYAVTGLLGLGLATGSEYSTAIWIPSGVALGAVLVFGLQALPGIFLGSLFVNYFTTIHGTHDSIEYQALIIGSVIATNAVLQAFVGWALISKHIGLNNTMNEPNDILNFAFLSGPVSCLVNATLSTLFLLNMHLLPISNFFVSWFTWYIGDAVGVLIFTPIFLILFGIPRSLWRTRVIPILIPLSTSFVVVAITYSVLRNQAVENNQLWFLLVCGFLFCVLVNITLFIIHGQKNLVQLQMREILRSAGEGVFGLDSKENIIFVNPAVEEMWKNDETVFLGKSIHHFIRYEEEFNIDLHDKLCPFHLAFTQNKTTHTSNILLTRNDGSSIWIEYICSPLIVAGKTMGSVIVSNDITQRRESEFHLENLAHYDILTGFPNRSRFIETLNNAIMDNDKSNLKLSVCFLDLDNFKFINDKLGHSMGDIVLQTISLTIVGIIGENDYFARLGGDEFGIILYNKSQKEVDHICSRLIHELSTPIEIQGTLIHVSISVGVATFPDGGETGDELIKNADIAMYRAKESGKNTFAHFNAKLSESINRMLHIDSEMRSAVKNNELSLCYQPQIDTSTNEITGLEVLLRWKSHALGNISPAEFIPIAERNRMIYSIGEWVLQQLAYESQFIQAATDKDIVFAINVSVMQLSDKRFFESLVDIMMNAKLKNLLMLEITETALMINPKETIEMMQNVSHLNIKFSLDDFGINYSSMRYLKNLPISQIKIDYIFVKDITHDRNDRAIVNTIIQLSHGLGIPAIAEGVETREQLELLNAMGCKYVQGYYFYHPMPLKELLTILKTRSTS